VTLANLLHSIDKYTQTSLSPCQAALTDKTNKLGSLIKANIATVNGPSCHFLFDVEYTVLEKLA